MDALGLLYVGREGRILRVAVTGVEVGVVVCVFEATAEDGLSIALGIDGETDVGSELIRAVAGEVTGNSGIAVEERACGCRGEDGADLACLEGSHAEDGAAMEVVVREEVGCPAQAGNHGESPRGVPGVLRIHPGDGAAVGLLLLRALVEYVLGPKRKSRRGSPMVLPPLGPDPE